MMGNAQLQRLCNKVFVVPFNRLIKSTTRISFPAYKKRFKIQGKKVLFVLKPGSML